MKENYKLLWKALFFNSLFVLILSGCLDISEESQVNQNSDGSLAETLILTGPETVTPHANADFTFSFSPSYLDVASYECSLNESAFAQCPENYTLAGLSDGLHVLRVRGLRANSQKILPVVFSWQVDSINPTQPAFSLQPPAVLGLTTAPFEFSSQDGTSGIEIYECSLDSAPYVTCSSPHYETGLAEGAHNLRVRAIDFAGNQSTEVIHNWVVDTLPPAEPSLSLLSPVSSPDSDSTPTLRVSSLTNGDTVRLYDDSGCSNLLSSSLSSGTTLDVTAPMIISASTVNYYATATDPRGLVSPCTSTPVTYTYQPNQAFVSTWQTTTPNEVITLPIVPGFSYNFTVDWGDGSPLDTVTSETDPDRIHSYASAGTYTMTITGLLEAWSFHSVPGNRYNLQTIPSLGAVGWRSFNGAFRSCTNLTSVFGGDTSLVTDFGQMFYSAVNAAPDTSSWDTSAAIDMSYMFYNATTANPDTSAWDTSNATNMASMFYLAVIADPDTSSWNTSKVIDMTSMFRNTLAANPNVSNWNTSSVNSMSLMFAYTQLANPDVSSWDTSSVTNFSHMFSYAQLANPDVSNWNTSSATDLTSMFYNADFADPDVSGWNVSKVTDFLFMFAKAPNANPDVSGWNTNSAQNMSHMFFQAISANPDVSNWDTANVSNLNNTFNGAVSATPVTSSWDVASVENFSGTFANMSGNPDTSSWDTSSATSMAEMFSNNPVANPNTGSWVTSGVTDMSYMFNYATSASPNTSGWNTSLVADMSYMFTHAEVANPDTSGWDTSSVTNMRSMFSGADLANPNMSGWDISSVTNFTSMFFDITLPTVTYSNFLIQLEAQNSNNGISFHGGNSEYNAGAAAARAALINDHSWSVIDGGLE